MRRRVAMLMLLIVAGSMLGLPGTAERGNSTETVSITFSFSNATTLSPVDTATVTVIEGWTGTVLEQILLDDGDSLGVIANHSIRLRIEAPGYEDWVNIATVYDGDASLAIELTNSSEDYGGINSTLSNHTAGLATLGLPSQMGPSSSINLSWSAVYSFSMQYGTELMPSSSSGLASQIDLWLGDADQILSEGEIDAFIAWMGEQAWSDAFYGGCCRLDAVLPEPQAPVSPVSVWIADDASTWGWNETATLTADTGFTSSRLLQVPLQNDIRQQAPLRVQLSDPWEFRYSPDSDLINGSPTDFEIVRDSSGVGGFLPVTLAQNTAPQASGGVNGQHGQALPHSENITLDGSESSDSSHDAGLGPTLSCMWTLSTNSTVLDIEGEVATVNLSASGFSAGEQLETLLTCTDMQGLSDTWNDTWYIDSDAPVGQSLSGTMECLDDPGQTNLLLCEELAAISSSVMSLNLSVSDDGPAETLVFWNSNHIEGWSSEGSEINVVFWQGQNTNINFLAVNGQHEQRQPAVWVFQLRASDEVGNDWIKAWNVTVLDGTAPRIDINLLNASGAPLDQMQSLRSDMQLTLDLNASFDDLHAIEDVRFIVSFDDEVLADSDQSGWEGVRMIALPALSVGLHDLVINATDGAGNTGEEMISLVIEPAIGIDITSIVVEPVTNTEPGLVMLNFSIVNSGATPYNATICIAEQCYVQYGEGATFEGEGMMYAELEFTLPASRGLDINYTFAGDGEQQSFIRTHDVDIAEQGGSSRTFIGTVATIAVLALAAWIYRRR